MPRLVSSFSLSLHRFPTLPFIFLILLVCHPYLSAESPFPFCVLVHICSLFCVTHTHTKAQSRCSPPRFQIKSTTIIAYFDQMHSSNGLISRIRKVSLDLVSEHDWMRNAIVEYQWCCKNKNRETLDSPNRAKKNDDTMLNRVMSYEL